MEPHLPDLNLDEIQFGGSDDNAWTVPDFNLELTSNNANQMEDNSTQSIVIDDSNTTVDEEPLEANRAPAMFDEQWLDLNLNIKFSNCTGNNFKGLKERLTAALQHCPGKENIVNATLSVAEGTNFTYKCSDLNKNGNTITGTVTHIKLGEAEVRLDSERVAILFLQLWNLFSKQPREKKTHRQRQWKTDFTLKQKEDNNLYFSVTKDTTQFNDINWTLQGEQIIFKSFPVQNPQRNLNDSRTNPKKRKLCNNNSVGYTNESPFTLRQGPIFICNTCNRCYSTQHEHTCGHSIDVVGSPSYSINGNLSVNGYHTANRYYTLSDARFKHSIELLENSNVLDDIEPVTYKLNNDPQQRKVFGLIAQNVEQHLPEAVITNENGYKGVDYIQFIPLLIRGYQEQKEELQSMKTKFNSLESDSSRYFLAVVELKNTILFTEHGHSKKLAAISVFESIVFEKQNWTTARQHLLLELIFLFPSYVGNFTKRQMNSILNQIQSVTLWTNAETDAMAKLCIGVLLYASGKRFKAAKQFQQLIDDSHDAQIQKMALAYLIAIRYSNDNEEDAVKLTNDLQRMLSNDKEKNYYCNQVVMIRVSYLFKQRRMEEIEGAISEWRNIVAVSTKGESTQHKILHYLPIDIFQAECLVLRNNYTVAEDILKSCLNNVGDSHHYTLLLKSKLLGVLTQQCKYKGAISLAEELLLVESKKRNFIGILSELKNLICLHYLDGRKWNEELDKAFNFAITLLDEIDEYYEEYEDLFELTYELAMDVAFKREQRKEGIMLFKKLIKICDKCNTNIDNKVLAYSALGTLCYEQKDIARAESYFSLCDEFANCSSNLQFKLQSKQNLIRFHMDKKEWQKGLKFAGQQLNILNSSKDSIQRHESTKKFPVFIQLANIYLEMQNWKMTEICLQQCAKHSTDYDSYHSVLQRLVQFYQDTRVRQKLGEDYCAEQKHARLMEFLQLERTIFRFI